MDNFFEVECVFYLVLLKLKNAIRVSFAKEFIKNNGFSNVSFIIQLMCFGTHCGEWYKESD